MEMIVGALGIVSVCVLIGITIYTQYVTRSKKNLTPLLGVVTPKKKDDKDA